MVRIEFECPKCGRRKFFAKAPREVRCPRCRRVFAVTNHMMLDVFQKAFGEVFKPDRNNDCKNLRCRDYDAGMVMHCARSMSKTDDRPYALVCDAYDTVARDVEP